MKEQEKRKDLGTVLITGASSGIGYETALHLDKLGYKVYAGYRKDDDAKALSENSINELVPIKIDVTDEESIEKGLDQIESETGRLDGLVNNAGLGLGGALEVTPMGEIQKVMNVNVIGLLAATKAFLPLLRESSGRIINIGSVAGYLSSPGASVYSGSKFAVRAITDSLRLELNHFGIKVVLVSPGAIESAIWEKGQTYRDQLKDNVNPEIGDLYTALRRFGDSLYKDIKRTPAIEVARVVEDALANKHPKRHYIVGKDAKGAKKATSILPTAMMDRAILKRIEKFETETQ